jgi:hypothetical protein
MAVDSVPEASYEVEVVSGEADATHFQEIGNFEDFKRSTRKKKSSLARKAPKRLEKVAESSKNIKRRRRQETTSLEFLTPVQKCREKKRLEKQKIETVLFEIEDIKKSMDKGEPAVIADDFMMRVEELIFNEKSKRGRKPKDLEEFIEAIEEAKKPEEIRKKTNNKCTKEYRKREQTKEEDNLKTIRDFYNKCLVNEPVQMYFLTESDENQ